MNRRARLASQLALPFAGRTALFVAADALLLGGGLLAALFGGDQPRTFYAVLVLLPLLLLGVLPMSEVVAIERRAGSLEMALALPRGGRYFERRLALLVALATAQSWLVVALLWLHASRSFPLLPALVQPAMAAAFLGAAALFWGARFASAGGTWAATLLSAAAAWPWLGHNPVPPPEAAPHAVFGSAAEIGTALASWLVLGAAAAALLLFARRRLAGAAPLAATVLVLAGVLLSLLGCGPEPVDPPADRMWTVQTETVQRAPFQPTVLLLGVLRPARSMLVKAPAEGVVHYPARFPGRLPTGAQVAAGEVLLTIANPTLDLGLEEARLALESAKADLDRSQRSFAQGLIPRVELEHTKVQESLAEARYRHAQVLAAHLLVRAPMAGRLAIANTLPDGSQVLHDTELAEIVGPGNLQVAARATPAEIALLHAGLAGSMRTAEGDDQGTVTISEVPPAVDATGAALILARVDQVRRQPIAGEGVQLEVALDPRQAITVPEEALVMTAAGQAAFVVSGSQPPRARLQPVTTGGRAGGRVEVIGGLRPGNKVVVHGTAALSNGAAVREEPPGADSTGPAEAAGAPLP